MPRLPVHVSSNVGLGKKDLQLAESFPKCEESGVQIPRHVDDDDALVAAEQEQGL